WMVGSLVLFSCREHRALIVHSGLSAGVHSADCRGSTQRRSGFRRGAAEFGQLEGSLEQQRLDWPCVLRNSVTLVGAMVTRGQRCWWWGVLMFSRCGWLRCGGSCARCRFPCSSPTAQRCCAP